MGVHTTFVRSVDLDEWTQRQIDAMRLGGNENARQFFRNHGVTDMHGKIEKKYSSKAARAYRADIDKQLDIAAAQRGEETSTGNTPAAVGSLLENLSLQDQQNATAKLQALKPVKAAVPMGKKASELSGAKGKLVVTPPTSGNLLRKPTGSLSTSSAGMLRKPAGKTLNTKMLLKRPSGSASSVKLRMNSKLPVDDKITGFDEMNEKPPAPVPAPPQLAVPAAVVKAPVVKKEPPKPKLTAMQSGVSRMKNMNSDFFSGI